MYKIENEPNDIEGEIKHFNKNGFAIIVSEELDGEVLTFENELDFLNKEESDFINEKIIFDVVTEFEDVDYEPYDERKDGICSKCGENETDDENLCEKCQEEENLKDYTVDGFAVNVRLAT